MKKKKRAIQKRVNKTINNENERVSIEGKSKEDEWKRKKKIKLERNEMQKKRSK